jgi:hypothetical protein
VLSELSGDQLAEVRQRALELAVAYAATERETAAERRKRITTDADAWVKFILAGKLS